MKQVTPSAARPASLDGGVGRSAWGRLGARAVLAGGAFLVLLLLLGAGWLTWFTYQRDVNEAAITAGNLTTTLAAHARQTIGAADHALLAVIDHVKPEARIDEATFRKFYSTREMFDTLGEAASGVPQIDVISVADSDGTLVNLTRGFPLLPPVNVADRDFFRTAIQPRFTGMTLGTPVHNKVTGAWTFFLARQITAPDGTPLGTAQVGLSIDFFQDFYRDINIGDGSAISLFRNDGILLARAPMRNALLGKSFAGQPVFKDGIAKGVIAAVLHPSDYRLADGALQSSRVLAFRLLDDLPVVVNTTLTDHLYLASWYRETLGIGIGTLAMAAAVLALSVALARMIARLRSSETVLGDQRRMLAVTLNAMNQGIMLITADRMVPVCNRRARTLLELPDDIDQNVHSLDQIQALQASSGHALVDAGADLRDGFEVEYTRSNGLILRIEQMPLDDGGAVRIFTDVTRQRQAEAHLRQAQKLDALGQLTAGIAHDFNNILGVIISSVDLMADPNELSGRELATIVGRVRDAALTAADLVRGMLNFSRQQDMKSQPTDVAALIKRSLPLLRQVLADQLTIRADLPTDLWPAQVDGAQIESALLNLVLNGRDAAPRDGVLRIAAANQVIVAGMDGSYPRELTPGPYVVISLNDRGMGMEPDVLTRVFEPFFTTKKLGKGSGLGLSMVFGTMRQLSGAVSIDSTLGEGTTVRLYLPRADRAPPLSVPVASKAITSHLRILLVEDNAGLRETADGLLKMLGHEVVAVGDADEAMMVWQTDQRFDLVFSDVMMPGSMNGVELVLKLRDQAPGLKVLLTSGFADLAGAHEAIRQEHLTLIQKPYRLADLVANLGPVLAAGLGHP